MRALQILQRELNSGERWVESRREKLAAARADIDALRADIQRVEDECADLRAAIATLTAG